MGVGRPELEMPLRLGGYVLQRCQDETRFDSGAATLHANGNSGHRRDVGFRGSLAGYAAQDYR